MKTVHVNLGEKAYPIYIHNDWNQLFQEAIKSLKSDKAMIITDGHIHPLYYQEVESIVHSLGIDCSVAVVSPGEESKSFKVAEELYTAALNNGLDRNSLIIALGGGVVGDLAGFIAATYMRGIPFIQIPTSLLAQLDSSIGGKVAINHPQAKNVIGSFYQPKCVLMNISTLRTLPDRELSTGMAELIKHGIIWDEDLLSWLEVNMNLLMAHDTNALEHAIHRSCEIKAYIVEQDEKEQGLRAILNFGHTVGHAIETITRFTTYTHGEAVSLGMIVEAQIAQKLGLIDKEYVQRIKYVLTNAGLPIVMPRFDRENLISLMKHDKKNTQGRIVFVLPTAPGHVEIFKDIKKEIILDALEDFHS